MSLPGRSFSSRRLRAALLAGATLASAAVGACSKGDRTGDDGSAPNAWQTTPAAPALRRLLARQYQASVRYLLGDAVAAAATPPGDPAPINGFVNISTSQLALNDDIVASYESSARAIAVAAMLEGKRVDQLTACTPTSVADAKCLRAFIANFGRLAWRRPLTAAEIDDYGAVGQKGALQANDFHGGIQLVLSAMLQSPNFLYEVAIGTPDPARADRRKLDGFELAARLSFFLIGRTPDSELIDAAEKGELDTPAGIKKWATTLLAMPEAKVALGDFFRELFELDNLPYLAKDPKLYPGFSPELAASMQEETVRIALDAVYADKPFTQILTTTQTFVDDKLAAFYGVPAPKTAWDAVTLPASQGRSGVLTTAGILSVQAHPTSTSALHRGLFIMQRFLCQSTPPPPPGVVTTLPPSSAAPTLRDRMKVHETNPQCKACHHMPDTLGLTLEHFDGVGQWRDKENGATIDVSGNIDGVGSWSDPASLAKILASSDAVKSCLLREVYRYASGHVEVDSEWPTINTLSAQWQKDGFKFRALLVELVASDLFRNVGSI